MMRLATQRRLALTGYPLQVGGQLPGMDRAPGGSARARACVMPADGWVVPSASTAAGSTRPLADTTQSRA
jgi:hypothetical protein